ncbi:hypothetical protein Gpo141_00007146 [Globisporangium polare]
MYQLALHQSSAPTAGTTTPSGHAMHRHQPLTAVSLLCAACAGLDELAPTINSFIDPPIRKRWTIERACELNNLTALRHLIAREAPDAVHPLYRSHVFSLALVHAVRHDNVEMLECLCAFCPSGYASKGMAEAAALGKVHLMEWLLANGTNVQFLAVYAQNGARGGHLNVLQWLKKQPATTNWHLSRAIEHAAQFGHLAVVQWLHENAGPVTSPFTCQAMQRATENGHLNVLKYLVAHGYEYTGWYNKSHVAFAVEAGSLEMAQWLTENGYAAPVEKDLWTAFYRGHSGIAKWLLHAIEIPTTDKQECALATAAESCDFEVVQLVHALYPPKRYSSAMITAAGRGRMDVVEWLFRTGERLPQDRAGLLEDRRCGYNYEYALSRAAAGGHFTVVQWLFHHLRALCSDQGAPERSAIEAAAGRGRADIVEWLFSRVHTDDTRFGYDITLAVELGHLELVEWIAARADVYMHMQIVSLVATNGHLAMLKWLHREFPNKLRRESSAMMNAVEKDHLPVVKWLYEHNRGDNRMQSLNSATSFEMVQWLHAHDWGVERTAYAMECAAERGDFDTLLFLRANGLAKSLRDVAHTAHLNGHVPIFEWLYETYPDVVDLDRFRSHPATAPAFVSSQLLERVNATAEERSDSEGQAAVIRSTIEMPLGRT